MQGGEHGGRHERARPDHAARLHQPLAGQAGKGVAQDLRRQRQEDLVDDARVLVVEVRLLDDDLYDSAGCC